MADGNLKVMINVDGWKRTAATSCSCQHQMCYSGGGETWSELSPTRGPTG